MLQDAASFRQSEAITLSIPSLEASAVMIYIPVYVLSEMKREPNRETVHERP
jgi:hypothetical protein